MRRTSSKISQGAEEEKSLGGGDSALWWGPGFAPRDVWIKHWMTGVNDMQLQ